MVPGKVVRKLNFSRADIGNGVTRRHVGTTANDKTTVILGKGYPSAKVL
jgi:hypothetical protein